MMRIVVQALTVSAIVMISNTHASAEAERCSPVPEALDQLEAVSEPAPAPEALFLVDGETERSLAHYRGRGVVLNFWATWCAPCVREMPALDALRAELAPAGVEVLAISSDFGGATVVDRFYAKNDIQHLPVLNDQRGRLAKAFALAGLPTTVLIDGEGREVARLVGPAEWDDAPVAEFLRDCLAPTG